MLTASTLYTLSLFYPGAGHVMERISGNKCGHDPRAPRLSPAVPIRKGSFRPEDEARLTPDILGEIERRFTTALGLSEHQRHCAVHTDTQNIHLQVGYNLIHLTTLTRNDHSWDYNKRDALCRELEREYGLTVDNGMEKERQPRTEKAVAVEAQGLQSFDGYTQERKASILAALDTAIAAQSWLPLHKELHRYGLEIRPRGNGLIIKIGTANRR